MSNIKEAIIDILKIFPFTIIILYLVMQKVTKRFKLYTQILRIEYPISFFMKPKEILLNEVDYIKFDENSGARKVPFLVIYYKNETGKNKQKISFSHDYKEIQILINKIRELGVKVEVISNVMWK